MQTTFGPAYSATIDGPRLSYQHEAIREFMLETNTWWTLAELAERLHFPEGSISAQLRHLRKPRYGGYRVEKRRRKSGKGTWEYHVYPKETLF